MDFDFLVQVLQSMSAAVKRLFNFIDLIVRNKWDPVATPPPSATIQHPFIWPYPPWMDKLPTCLAGELTTCPFFADTPSSPEFGLDLHDAGTAKEQVVTGVLESLGLEDWEFLHETLSGSSNMPSVDVTQLFPLILFVLCVCIIWLVIQELFYMDEGYPTRGVRHNHRLPLAGPSEPPEFTNVDDISRDLYAPAPTGNGSNAVRAPLEPPVDAESPAVLEPASPSSSAEDDSMVSSDSETLSAEDEPQPSPAPSLSILNDSPVSPYAEDVHERAPSSQAATVAAHSGPSAAPSFDVLEPLAAAPSALAVSLMDENLEESLSDEVLRSAGLITPADSAAQVAVSDVEELTGNAAPPLVAGELVLPGSDAPGGDTLAVAIANSTASQEHDVRAHPSVIEFVDAPFSCKEIATLDDCEDPSPASSSVSATQAMATSSSSLSQGIPDYMPSDWSLAAPSSDLENVIGERISAEDWTTIKSFVGMQDDRENEFGLQRMTLVRECRPPLHFPDPCALEPSTTREPDVELEEPFCPRQARTLFRPEHRRAFTEPPPLSDPEWIRAELDPLPQLSATRARLDIFKDPRCPVLPTDADARFPLKSPELQGHFPSIAAQMGFILHNRSHARFAPPAEAGLVVKEEQAALRLAALPELRRRHSTAGFGAPTQGLSKAEFLRMYIPYIRDQLSYAEVTSTGVTPWGRVVRMGTIESPSPSRDRLNLRKSVEVNKNRGGLDINMHGADMKAEYTRPLPPLRRQSGLPFARTPPRVPIGSASEQSPTPSRSRQRTASVSQQRLPAFASSVQSDLRRASLQSNAPSSSPNGGHHRSRSESPLASTPARRTRFVEPVLSPIPSSPSPTHSRSPSFLPLDTSEPSHTPSRPARSTPSLLARRTSAPALPRLTLGGRPRALAPVAGSPPKGAPTTALTPVHSAMSALPSLEAIAATVAGGRAGAAVDGEVQVYPRIDDDGALEQFESELGVVGDV